MLPKRQEETGSVAQSTEPSDAELATRLRDTGDREAFAALMRRHGPTIATFLSRLTGGREELLLDKVYWRIQDRSYAIREPENFLYWALGMASSIWRDAAPSIAPLPEDAPLAWKALSRIAYPLRPVFVMVHYLRLPLERVASALRIPRGAALARLHDAFASLSVQFLPAPKPAAPPPEAPKDAPKEKEEPSQTPTPPPPPPPAEGEEARPLPWAMKDKTSFSAEEQEKEPPAKEAQGKEDAPEGKKSQATPSPEKDAGESAQKSVSAEAPQKEEGAPKPGKEAKGPSPEATGASAKGAGEEAQGAAPLSTLIPRLTVPSEGSGTKETPEKSAPEEKKGVAAERPGSS